MAYRRETLGGGGLMIAAVLNEFPTVRGVLVDRREAIDRAFRGGTPARGNYSRRPADTYQSRNHRKQRHAGGGSLRRTATLCAHANSDETVTPFPPVLISSLL